MCIVIQTLNSGGWGREISIERLRYRSRLPVRLWEERYLVILFLDVSHVGMEVITTVRNYYQKQCCEKLLLSNFCVWRWLWMKANIQDDWWCCPVPGSCIRRFTVPNHDLSTPLCHFLCDQGTRRHTVSLWKSCLEGIQNEFQKASWNLIMHEKYTKGRKEPIRKQLRRLQLQCILIKYKKY